MHVSALAALAFAGLAAAQTTHYPTTKAVSGCGSQIDLLISTCLGTTQPQLLACPTNDWDCMCTQSTSVLTCYNNCESSPDRFGFEQSKIANCDAASAYGTSAKATSTGSSSASLSAVVAAATPSSTTPSGTSNETESASTSGSTASETGAAVVNAALPVGGLFAAVFGLAAWL